MTQDLAGAAQQVLEATGVSIMVAAAVAVISAVVAAASVVAMVRARRAAAGAQAAAVTALVFEHSPAGMALSDAAGRLRAVNPTLARWCAATPGALVGRHLGELVDPADAGALAGALRAGPTAAAGVEVRLLPATGGQGRWVRLRITALAATATTAALCVIHVEDAGQAREATARLIHDARHDALTGLPNRRSLIGALEGLLARGGGGAVVMLDLDGFKAVNDDLGHAGGDELLVVVAQRLASCLRPGEMAARLGGDELVVLARDVVDQGGAHAVGQRVLAAVVGPVTLDAGAAVVAASIGVRRLHPGDALAGVVLGEADAALYRAKAAGGGCVRHAQVGQSRTGAGLRAPAPVSISA